MFNIFIKTDPETKQQLDRMIALLYLINERTTSMSLDFSNVQREISELGVAIGAIAERLRQNDGDQAAINEIAAQLDVHGKALEALAAPAPAPEQTDQPVV